MLRFADQKRSGFLVCLRHAGLQAPVPDGGMVAPDGSSRGRQCCRARTSDQRHQTAGLGRRRVSHVRQPGRRAAGPRGRGRAPQFLQVVHRAPRRMHCRSFLTMLSPALASPNGQCWPVRFTTAKTFLAGRGTTCPSANARKSAWRTLSARASASCGHTTSRTARPRQTATPTPALGVAGELLASNVRHTVMCTRSVWHCVLNCI